MSEPTGEEIRAWRESKDLDRKELGDLCSVSAATVANWELERNKPHGAARDKLLLLMQGKTAVMPLTDMEERILAQLVSNSGYATREEYLSNLLLEQFKRPPNVAAKKAPGKNS